MFVRKGTISRKGRGSGRKSVRRPGRESNGTAPPRKVTIHDDPSSTGSGSYRIPPSPDFCSNTSFRVIAEDESSVREGEDGLNLKKLRTEDKYSPAVEDRLYQNHLRPSPARSLGNTIVVSIYNK